MIMKIKIEAEKILNFNKLTSSAKELELQVDESELEKMLQDVDCDLIPMNQEMIYDYISSDSDFEKDLIAWIKESHIDDTTIKEYFDEDNIALLDEIADEAGFKLVKKKVKK